MPFGFMAPSNESNPTVFWGRQPPSQINVILIASGGGSVGGGGGGGGVVILNNLTTDFFPTLGTSSPVNKTTFRVYGRNQPASNGVSNGFDTVFTTYNSDGSTKNEYTAIGGGFGNQSVGVATQQPGGSGGSGGGAGGVVNAGGNPQSTGGAGTGTQGKAGGNGFFAQTYVNPYLYTIFGSGGGGGYSAVGTAGSNSSLTLYGGNGGNGLSLAPYLSSAFQTFFTDGSLAANGYSNYSSIVAASGAGGFTIRSGGFVAGTPGTGAGKSINGQHTATGFGCGAACTESTLLGEAGGGLAIMSYAGSPYANIGYRQYDGTRTYHVFFGPPDSINQRGTYYTFTCQM